MTGQLRVVGLALALAATMSFQAQAQWAGSRPQVPISYAQWQRLNNDPGALARLGATLPPISDTSAPGYGPPRLSATLTSIFSPENAPVGAWTTLTNPAPTNLSNPRLLTDGTVIAHSPGTVNWYKLTPNSSGSYVGGTWSAIANLPTIGASTYKPNFFASGLLPDGRFIINGGEYDGSSPVWQTRGAIYDPVGNTWTSVPPPAGWSTIGDASAAVLPDGTYMVSSCCDGTPFPTAKLNASTLAFTQNGLGKADRHDEESWVVLPNGSILTVDAYTTAIGAVTCGTNTEVFNPATNTWTSAGSTPAPLADCAVSRAQGGSPTYEIGPNQLMYNGKVIAFGGNTAGVANTALYNTATGSWSAGPNLPSTCGSGATSACTLADAPSIVMPNGNVLFAAGAGAFNTPTSFFEYDPTANTFSVAPATLDAATISDFYVNLLQLPTGQVLALETYTATAQIYTPSGSYASSLQPVITSVASCVAPGSTYTIAGTQLNGLTEGAQYGDDVQMASNYPLVRITNNATGHVFYARTLNHSSRSIAPGVASTADFRVSGATEPGASTLVVVANGIPSATQNVTVGVGCPSAPLATAATGVGTDYFTGNWNASAGATGYRIDVVRGGIPIITNQDAGNATSFQVTGLTAETGYSYVVRAYNSTGTSANSNTIQVTTTTASPSAPLATAATGVGTDHFTGNWNASAGATGYRIDVVRGGIPIITNQDAGNATSFQVTGLTAGTGYSYVVRAYNSTGTSANSNTIQVTTTTTGTSGLDPLTLACLLGLVGIGLVTRKRFPRRA